MASVYAKRFICLLSFDQRRLLSELIGYERGFAHSLELCSSDEFVGREITASVRRVVAGSDWRLVSSASTRAASFRLSAGPVDRQAIRPSVSSSNTWTFRVSGIANAAVNRLRSR